MKKRYFFVFLVFVGIHPSVQAVVRTILLPDGSSLQLVVPENRAYPTQQTQASQPAPMGPSMLLGESVERGQSTQTICPQSLFGMLPPRSGGSSVITVSSASSSSASSSQVSGWDRSRDRSDNLPALANIQSSACPISKGLSNNLDLDWEVSNHHAYGHMAGTEQQLANFLYHLLMNAHGMTPEKARAYMKEQGFDDWLHYLPTDASENSTELSQQQQQ